MIIEGKVVCNSRNKEVLINNVLHYEYSFMPVYPDATLVQGSILMILTEKDKFAIGTEYTLTFSAIEEE